MFNLTSSYNTKVIPLDYVFEKFVQTVKVMFEQFMVVLPFMEYKYKLMLAIMSSMGLIAIMYKAKVKKTPLVVILLLMVLFVSKFAYFVADERGEILAEMEDFAFVPRLDFYGIVYVYALFLSFLLTVDNKKLKKLAVVFIGIITFMSMVRDTYALKTWKLGFDAEMKTHERIVSRLEKTEGFDANRKYKLLQVGSLSLRKNYYITKPEEKVGLDLLETSFTPQFMSRIVYNFYYPNDLFYDNASYQELSMKAKNFLKNKAKPWPSQEAIYIDGNIIVIVLTNKALNELKYKLM
jgi:hypothetical protein